MINNLEGHLKLYKKGVLFNRRDINSAYFLFDLPVATINVHVPYHQETILHYVFNFSSSTIPYDNLVSFFLELKTEFISYFGTPILDNTNHFHAEDIMIQFKENNWDIYLQCNKKVDMVNATITFLSTRNHSRAEFVQSKKKVTLTRWISYFIAGQVWGLLMFLTNGKGYDWKNFLIWMAGGLSFTLLFGIFMEIFFHFNGKEKKISKKIYKNLLSDCRKDADFLFLGQVLYHKGKKHSKPILKIAVIDIKDKIVCLHFSFRKKVTRISISESKFISDSILHGETLFQKDGINYYFMYPAFNKDQCNINSYIEKKFLEFKKDPNYDSLLEEVQKEIISYHPFSLYEEGEEINYNLNRDFNLLATYLYLNPDCSFATIVKLISFMYNSEAIENDLANKMIAILENRKKNADN